MGTGTNLRVFTRRLVPVPDVHSQEWTVKRYNDRVE